VISCVLVYWKLKPAPTKTSKDTLLALDSPQ
jgi:hypothetical protein